MSVLVSHPEGFAILSDEQVSSICTAVLRAEGEPTTPEISVSFVDDVEIAALNQQYRGEEGPTDVLSFAFRDEINPEFAMPAQTLLEMRPEILGDIVISLDTAARYAATYEMTLQRELAFLLIHGTLHLLGYDHADESEEREMFALQERYYAEVIAALGI